MHNLEIGGYLVTAFYNGDENFESVTISDEHTVNSIKVSVGVYSSDFNGGDDEIIP